MEDLYPAQLDGISLEIETLDDSFEKAIARHEIPKKQGALLEDMGQRARTVNVRCYFWDHGSHQTYNDHVKLLNHLKETELSELVHPQYGVVKGMVERVSVRHDDRERTAEVDLSFVENLRTDIQEVAYEDVEAAAEEAVVAAQDEQMDAFAADVQAELGPESVGILEQDLNPEQGIFSQFQGYSQKAKNYLKRVDTFVSTLEGTLTDVANPANGITSTISYGTKLPGRVIGAVARCVERYVKMYDSVKKAPSRFLDNLEQARLDLESKAGFSKHLKIAFSAQGGRAVAQIYKDDETSRQQVRRSEKVKSFDTQGNYRAPSETAEILTIADLEASLNTVRTMLQSAVDEDRSMESLKAMAKSLLDHVNTIKLERDRILTVDLDNPMPMHLLCHIRGLNYNYAERVLSINRIKNPNFTNGRVQIYGR